MEGELVGGEGLSCIHTALAPHKCLYRYFYVDVYLRVCVRVCVCWGGGVVNGYAEIQLVTPRLITLAHFCIQYICVFDTLY